MTEPPTAEEIHKLKRQLLKKGAEVNEILTRLLAGEQVSPERLLGGGKKGATPIEKARRWMALIDASLKRVADGSYGRCITCGDGLPVLHLQQIPWIDTCQACAAKAENPEEEK
jgi:DnaK suppressor protein